MEWPRIFLSTVVLDAPDVHALAGFYCRLLGWAVEVDEPEFVLLSQTGGGTTLSFQHESVYVRPTWPAGPGDQQMMLHLDFKVEELEAASAFAVAIGATLCDYQPQENVRVHLDPAGHPFCLWV